MDDPMTEPLAHRLARMICDAMREDGCALPVCGCSVELMRAGQAMAKEIAATYDETAWIADDNYFGHSAAERIRERGKEVVRDEKA